MNRPPFELSRRVHRGVVVLAVAGEVDVDTAEELREELTSVLTGRNAVVELSKVDFMDSTGLGVLVAGHRCARSNGHRMALAAVPSRVLSILELTRLTPLFALYADLDEAVDDLLDEASPAL